MLNIFIASPQYVHCFTINQLRLIAWTGVLSIIFKTRDQVHPIKQPIPILREHPNTLNYIVFCRKMLSLDKCIQKTANPSTYDLGRL